MSSPGRQDAGYTVLGSLFLGILLLLVNRFLEPIDRPSPGRSTPRSSTRNARELSGTYPVIGISDGDTLTVLRQREQLKVRLAGIDTPEKGQPFGTQAHKALASRVANRRVRIQVQDTDRYGRLIADVYDEKGHVNLWLVEQGFAWHYAQYSSDPALAVAQQRARSASLGLWADRSPVPPWNWRRLSAAERNAYR